MVNPSLHLKVNMCKAHVSKQASIEKFEDRPNRNWTKPAELIISFVRVMGVRVADNQSIHHFYNIKQMYVHDVVKQSILYCGT